jgi:hypothetical protein
MPQRSEYLGVRSWLRHRVFRRFRFRRADATEAGIRARVSRVPPVRTTDPQGEANGEGRRTGSSGVLVVSPRRPLRILRPVPTA